VIRLDRAAPEWASCILADLEAGCTGAEAVQRAAEGLLVRAAETAKLATEAETRAAAWEVVTGVWIDAEDLVRDYRARAAEHRRYERALRREADQVAQLRGEYISVAGLLR
jgi:citrate lyase beta subunit